MCNDRINIELIFYSRSTLLESPVWSSQKELLYCVSIEQNLIYQIDPENGYISSFKTAGPVGCVAIKADGNLLSAEKEGIFEYNLDKMTKIFLTQPETNPLMRYNDGTLDQRGRFLVGTKGLSEEMPGKGKLYSYDGANSRVIIKGTTISNGIGFSRSGEKMYFIDTPTKKVGCYYYNVDEGTVTFEKYIIEIPGDGFPDGMCVDVDDMVWVAEWEGGKICKWNPLNGEKLFEIRMPCKRITSCCLGGTNLEYLFIASARGDKNEPSAGGLFRVKIR